MWPFLVHGRTSGRTSECPTLEELGTDRGLRGIRDLGPVQRGAFCVTFNEASLSMLSADHNHAIKRGSFTVTFDDGAQRGKGGVVGGVVSADEGKKRGRDGGVLNGRSRGGGGALSSPEMLGRRKRRRDAGEGGGRRPRDGHMLRGYGSFRCQCKHAWGSESSWMGFY